MKRLFASLLALMLLLCATAFATEAELDLPELTVEFDSLEYEGSWWSFEGTNIQLYMPSDWVEQPDKMVGGAQYEFVVGAPDDSSFVNIRVFTDEREAEYVTHFEGMVEELGTSSVVTDVSPARVNGVPMISYIIGEEDGLGVVILTDDAYLMLESAPGTEENATLFLQILSTYKLTEEE